MLSHTADPSTIDFLAPALLLIVVYAAVLALLYKYAANSAFSKEFNKSSTPEAILSIVNSGGVYLIVLAISAQYATNAIEFAYNVAAATFGLAMGWVLGIVISPSSTDEQSEFSMLTKAISTFLTGYVLAYFKDIKIEQVQHFLFDRPGVPFRLLVGTACCFSTLAVVFVSRRAEIMKANATREWFISYTPPDPKLAQGLRADVLARGPFATRDEALAEIERIKVRDEFKGVTLTAVRVNLAAEEDVTVPPTAPGNQSSVPADVPKPEKQPTVVAEQPAAPIQQVEESTAPVQTPADESPAPTEQPVAATEPQNP
jgi:hypothetical protein